MTKRVVEHKIKLEKSLTIILGVLALGVFINAFTPAFSVREAFADFSSKLGTKFDPFVVKFMIGHPVDYDGRDKYQPLKIKLDCKGCK